MKKLIKRIVMSHAYQLDSKFDQAAFEIDPDNALRVADVAAAA